MDVGDIKIYSECGERAKVEILGIVEKDGGEEFTLKVLGDISHGNIIRPEASFTTGETFTVWRTSGPGQGMCGWSLRNLE